MTQAPPIEEAMAQVAAVSRTYSDWASPRGLRKDILPWQLWEKAKRLMWDPADLDFSTDAKEFAGLPEEQRYAVAGLARGFMIGEEGVTLDILPLIMAMADEGRVEEVMYLTTFAFEEAKHVDFFRRWFDALDIDLAQMDEAAAERMRAQGMNPPAREPGLFEKELPRVMRRLVLDHSPRAVLEASVTYNQFVEGCLAMAGYKVWSQAFERFGVLPGLRQGLALVRRDESRHITYGTYLCRRIIAADPDLMSVATDRLRHLHSVYEAGMARMRQANGNGNGGGYGGGGAGPLGTFGDYVGQQVNRRIQVLERSSSLSSEDAELGRGSEEAEEELEAV